MTKIENLSIKDFNYFVKSVRKLINSNKKKGIYNYKNSKTSKINFKMDENKIQIDPTTGKWNVNFIDIKEEDTFLFKYKETNDVIAFLNKDQRILKFIEQAKELYREIILNIGNNDAKELAQIKKVFIKQITKNCLYTKITICMMGLGLCSKRFTIQQKSEDFKLVFSQPTLKDFKKHTIKSKQIVDTFGLIIKMISPQIDRSLEYKFQQEEYILKRILKLLFNSNISIFDMEIKREGSYGGIIGFGGNIRNFINEQIVLDFDKSKKIKKYYFHMREKLKSFKIFRDYYDSEISPCYIAIENYEEALKTHDLTKKVSLIIMGLESIFTSQNNDLKYALKMRIATILNIIDKQNSDVMQIINTAYQVRSDYVHGGMKRSQNKKNLLKLFNDDFQKCTLYISNFLRISILIVLFLDYGRSETELRKFQDLLDKIMIGDFKLKKDFARKITKYKNLFEY